MLRFFDNGRVPKICSLIQESEWEDSFVPLIFYKCSDCHYKQLITYPSLQMLQDWKGIIFGVHWHSKGVLHATSRGSLLHCCDPRPLLRLLPTGIHYLTFGALPIRPFPTMLASLGPDPLRFCSWSSDPQDIYPVAYQKFRNPFSALAGLRPLWHRPPLIPTGLCPFRGASLWGFTLRACP
jgi:hypothetical protein